MEMQAVLSPSKILLFLSLKVVAQCAIIPHLKNGLDSQLLPIRRLLW